MMGKFDWQEEDTVGITVTNPPSTADLDASIERVQALIRDAELEVSLAAQDEDK
jgi:tetrahydromethanopterin S-methyltransferase subunit F